VTLFEGTIERTLKPLRPRQEAAILGLRQAIREGHKRIIVQAPTGFGKTVLASHIIAGALDKGKKPIFCAPAIALINQTVASLENQGITDIGVIQANHPRTNLYARTQVGSIQTLIRRGIPKADIMLVDEAHNSWKKFNDMIDSDEWKDVIIVGLTATPWSRGMGLRWTELVVAATTKELITEGWLTPTIGYGPEKRFEPNISGLKSKRNEFGETDFDQEQGAKIMSQDEIVGNTVDMWLRFGAPDHTFLFAMNRKHAEVLQQAFIASGIPWGYIDGFSTPEERKELFEEYDRGYIRGIASVGCLTTGIDKDVRCIIDAQLCKSEITHVQKGGRGIRTAPGKEHLIYIDQAGNNQRLGFFFDIHHDHLDAHKPGDKGETYDKDQKPKPPKKCPNCHVLMDPGTRSCKCGHVEVAATDVEHAEGDLVLWGTDAKPKKKSAKKEATIEEKRQFYAELLGYCEIHGKKPGWAYFKAKEKFGVYPAGKVAPQSPSMETDRWCRSQMIKWIKGKEKEAKQAVAV
jgi:superfamily II DNA or RNA helicase